MATAEVSEIEDLVHTLKCVRAEKDEAQGDADRLERLASAARVRVNAALLGELSVLSRLESLGVTVDDWLLCDPCRKGQW